MLIENLYKGKKFVHTGRKFKTHKVTVDFGRAWVETACGTLICERIGTYVEVR